MTRVNDLPQLPEDQWPADDSPIWHDAEALVMNGSQFKAQDACRLCKAPFVDGWLNSITGKKAAELGAPVHQALFVATMRARGGGK